MAPKPCAVSSRSTAASAYAQRCVPCVRGRRRSDGRSAAVQRLDDGASLRVALEVTGDRLRVDFSGSSPTHGGNLNATPAVVRAVVLYVLRLLVAEPLPLNEGLLEAVELVIPEGM